MERTRPPLGLQKRARWLSVLVALIVLVGLSALFLVQERALAGQSERSGPIAAVADSLARVYASADLPPSAAPGLKGAPAGLQSALDSQDFQTDDGSPYIYTVQPGEYWIGIAGYFGISYPDLRTANSELWSLRHEIIRPGDQMVIPGVSVGQPELSANYVVKPGESWYAIANAFDVSFRELRLDNLRLWQQRGVYIHPGDELFVKDAPESPSTGESISGADEPSLAVVTEPGSTQSSTNGGITLPSNSTGTPILVGSVPADATVYTVRPGDTWYGIAAAYGVPFGTLRSANERLWSARGQRIHPADQMIIPAHGSPPPPPEIKTAPVDEVIPVPEEVEEEAASAEADGTALPATDVSTSTEDSSGSGPLQPVAPEEKQRHIEIIRPTLTYLVKAGEDWPTVAGKVGVSVDELKVANPALSGRELQEGDTVLFP